MYRENICKFVPVRPAADVIRTINFIYETGTPYAGALHTDAVYKMYMVASGGGTLRTEREVYTLEPGDLFFTFPSARYGIDGDGDFTYLYISFLGFRGNMLLEQCGVRSANPVLRGYGEALPVWQSFFALACEGNLDLISEATLLYTFSLIAKRTQPESGHRDAHAGVMQVKRYIDEHFSDPELSLEQLSKTFPYNKKYLSTAFKKQLNLTIGQYITVTRLQNARTLMEQNMTSVQDIAYLCGFSDPLYFSRVFKRETGVSPKEFVRSLGK